MTELPAAPDGHTDVLRSVSREQGLVVQALLDSTGIPAVLVGARSGLHSYTREPAHIVSVYVPSDRAEEARALLGAVVGDDES